jgi:DNA-directed RNA polymerase specialized sigma24 family protein
MLAPTFLSQAELSAAIAEFSELDWIRIKKAALHFCGRRGIDWEDLQNEALARALEGQRKCPKNVPVVTFLRNVIRSVASQLDGHASLSDELVEAQQETAAGAVPLTEPADPVASTMDATSLLEGAAAVFDDDEVARKLFEGIVDGIEGQKLRESLGLSQKEFDSKRRFVRRRLNQHFERNVS